MKIRHGFMIRSIEERGSSVFRLLSWKLGSRFPLQGPGLLYILSGMFSIYLTFIESLLCARYYSKCFMPINTFNHPNVFMRWLLILFQFH